MLLGFNFSTLSFLILPDWILDNYFGYLLSLSVCFFYIIFCIFLRKKSIVIPQFEKRYNRSHIWIFLLYTILSFISFAVVGMSDFNPNYKRKHQPYVEEVLIEFAPDTIH